MLVDSTALVPVTQSQNTATGGASTTTAPPSQPATTFFIPAEFSVFGTHYDASARPPVTEPPHDFLSVMMDNTLSQRLRTSFRDLMAQEIASTQDSTSAQLSTTLIRPEFRIYEGPFRSMDDIVFNRAAPRCRQSAPNTQVPGDDEDHQNEEALRQSEHMHEEVEEPASDMGSESDEGEYEHFPPRPTVSFDVDYSNFIEPRVEAAHNEELPMEHQQQIQSCSDPSLYRHVDPFL